MVPMLVPAEGGRTVFRGRQIWRKQPRTRKKNHVYRFFFSRVTIFSVCVICALAFGGACTKSGPDEREAPPRPSPQPPSKPDPDALPQATGLPPQGRAIQVVHGVERTVDAEAAKAHGLTVVDLADDWAPYLFQDGRATDGALLSNRYRAVFTGLANDRSDGDGQALPPGEKNYLELYGIPPALSVLRERFVRDAARGGCDAAVDRAKLLGVEMIATWGSTTEKKELVKHQLRAARLKQAQEKAGADTLDALALAEPRWVKDVKAHARFEAERAAFTEVEKRLVCEGLLDPAQHVVGLYDTPMRLAMLAFQQKHVVVAHGDITRGTLETLAQPLQENNLAALKRVLTERAAHAGGFLEDGSVLPAVRPGRQRKVPTYKSATGESLPVPDLVGPATEALLARLGIANAQDAAAFFARHPKEDFQWLKVAVRFPPAPPYYGEAMDLVAEIDRGDIWYDFPFDKAGNRVPQPRQRFPSFTLFVRWQGERVPLVSWRTTIGGWRSELAADGEEYLRYKDSDVGPRVWRHIVAAPVWIPPSSSPLGGMTKVKWVNGANVKVVNYDETGPGYLSAYGLAAAIHVTERKHSDGRVTYFDNGIRTHGSFDYMSLRGRFSHGCHRLYNNLAVRLFSFVLQHRRATTLGPMALNFRRTFVQPGGVFDMRLPTRGFYFELVPPLPVEVLEGDIKGLLKKPFASYLRKPGVAYTSVAPPRAGGGPENKAGGGATPLPAAGSVAGELTEGVAP